MPPGRPPSKPSVGMLEPPQVVLTETPKVARTSWKNIDPNAPIDVTINQFGVDASHVTLLDVWHSKNWEFRWFGYTRTGLALQRGYNLVDADDHCDTPKAPDQYGDHEYHIPSGAWRRTEDGHVSNLDAVAPQKLFAKPIKLSEYHIKEADLKRGVWGKTGAALIAAATESYATSAVGTLTEAGDQSAMSNRHLHQTNDKVAGLNRVELDPDDK